MAASSGRTWSTLRWSDDGIVLLDQRRLPTEEVYLTLTEVEDVAQAIESLAVRGAPAIGCTAALAVARAALDAGARDAEGLRRELEPVFARLERTRPTAVNLFWALGRMRRALTSAPAGFDASQVSQRLLDEALAIQAEDVKTCDSIGRNGLELVPDRARVLTHCNAGALATAGAGTALAIVRAAIRAGRDLSVLADETRPLLQGARLTAWELARDGVDVAVIADGAAGALMRAGEVDLVVVGADRIAVNGDVANKIGTYGLAVLAHAHAIPFIVAAPLSSVDWDAKSGEAIPIEERDREEIATLAGQTVLPDGVAVRNPAFDVTPARLVTAIVTEAAVLRPPLPASLAAVRPPQV